MKKLLFALLISVVVLPAFAQVDRTKPPEPGPAREIKIGEYQSFTLKNGLQVFVVENHKLPRVQFSLQLRHDPILEGPKAGYVSMAGDLLSSGTTTRPKAQLDEEVDFIGAALSTSPGGIFASSLTKHMDKLLELMTDVLYNPSYQQEELDKLRTQTLSALAAAKEDPDAIAGNVRSVLVYGSNHPYGELTTEETVKRITREDCIQYYKTYFKPNNAYLAIVGDINLKTAKNLAEKYFGKWQPGEIQKPSYPQPEPPSETIVAVVDRPASVQSVMSIAYPVELKPGSPDAIKAGVLNQILGGGSSGRLYKNLREDKGFTYGAYSSISSDPIMGSFQAGASVRNDVTDSAATELINEMKQLSAESVTDEELESAKAYLAGSFGRALERPQTVANFAVNIAKYNLPKDYYENYVKNISAVTKDDLKQVASKFVHPDRSYLIVVGKASEVAEMLETIGTVKFYNAYGNAYTPTKASALPPGLTADKVVSDYVAAVGGADKIRSIKTVKSSSKASVPGAELVINSLYKSPNKILVEMLANGNLFQKVVSDGEQVSITRMGQKTPVDESTREETLFEGYLVPELFLKESKVTTKLEGIEKVDDKDAYVVSYTFPSGQKSMVYFDVESGLKVKSTKTLETPQGEMSQSISYQDYKPVNGLQMPHTVIQQVGPQSLNAEVTSVEVNVPAEDSQFEVN
jgi:zinc protease